MAVTFFDVVLKLVGAFYALGTIFGLRRMATDFLLTQAIGAIGKPNPLENRAERERNLTLTFSLLLVGIGGVVLLAGLDLAAAIFVLSLLFYGVYLFVLAPLRFDPHDPPEEPGRSQTRNAFWIYLAATLLVVTAWWQGQLTALPAASPLALAFAGATTLALIGYAVRLRLQARLGGKGWNEGSGDDAATRASDEAEERRRQQEDLAYVRSRPLVMRPSWNRGALVDAETGETVFIPYHDHFTIDDENALGDWLAVFAEVGDRDDPWRSRLTGENALARIEAAGRPLFERLSQKLGHERFTFDPSPAPLPASRKASRVKVMPEHQCPALWIYDGDIFEPIEPDEFGLSWNLASDLNDWDIAYGRSLNEDDPGGPSPWSEAQFLEHEEQGRKLAVRLARELAATGRVDVEVSAYRRSTGAYPVQATDPI